MTKKGLLYVVAQFACLLTIVALEGFYKPQLYWLIMQGGAGLLGLSAILVMRNSRMSIFPEVKRSSKLVVKGPYRYIRHPMYAALLIYFFPFAVSSLLSAVLYALLFITLINKIKEEERLLQKAFSNYSDYMSRTKRLFPYLF
jgi:protein-S-isoprenylcysteine O-methyltransferase Ste14